SNERSVVRALLELAIMAASAGLMSYWLLSTSGEGASPLVLLLAPCEILGFWVLGMCLTTLVTFSELLVGSLRSRAAENLMAWVGIVGSLPETVASPAEASRVLGGLTESRRPDKAR